MKKLSDILKGKTCAVVSNSGDLTNYEYGELIDSYDVVIRCNWSLIGGYAKDLGGWVRGFAHVDDHFWVGVSPTAKRSDRAFGDALIRKYDENWNQVDELILEDEGQVLAILDIGRKASNPQLAMI